MEGDGSSPNVIRQWLGEVDHLQEGLDASSLGLSREPLWKKQQGQCPAGRQSWGSGGREWRRRKKWESGRQAPGIPKTGHRGCREVVPIGDPKLTTPRCEEKGLVAGFDWLG